MYIGKLSDKDYRIGKYITIGTSDKKESFSYMFLETNHVQLEDGPTSNLETFYTTFTCKFGKLFSIRFLLPAFIKPYFWKTKPTSWSQETIERLGRDWYYEYRNRCYGFYLDKSHISLKFGLTLNESGVYTDRDKYINFPWANYSYIYAEYYDSNNKVCATKQGYAKNKEQLIERTYAILKDYDGETVNASFSKVVRVYHRFSGKLLWLAKLLPKKRFGSFEINFDRETGSRKGSWKGGTIGASIPMSTKKTGIEGLKKYCGERGMTIVAITGTGYDDVRIIKKEETKENIPESVAKLDKQS